MAAMVWEKWRVVDISDCHGRLHIRVFEFICILIS